MSNTLNNLKTLSSIHNPFSSTLSDDKPIYTPKRDIDISRNRDDDRVSIEKILNDPKANDVLKEYADDVDDIFDSIDMNDENRGFKSNLIGLGRKYTLLHEDDGTVSEVDKAFEPQKNKLKDLLIAVNKDTEEVEKDISQIRRLTNGRNYQRMNELIETKAALHNTTLSIIKEMSAIEKNKFDIKSKLNKNTADTMDPAMASGSILQNIFGIGHDALLNSVDGREGSSGAIRYDEAPEDSDEYGRMIYNQNFPDYVNEEESEGDKFIKYENRGVELVLEERDNGDKTIYAQDAEGNIIDDYPIPKDIDSLTFEINNRTGTATDQLQRKYKYISV
jgi:hypothetical protein